MIWAIILWIALINDAHSQETAQVEILHSDQLTLEYVDNQPIKKLVGNVKLRHKGTLMYCDIATIYHTNNVYAEQRVKIVRPNGTTICGNTLNYLSEQKLAKLEGNVELIDKKANLYTPDITYDLNEDVGYYTNGGKIINDSTTITSSHGTYHSKTSQVFFRYNVKVQNPKYKLTTDTLEYNTKLKRNYFYNSTKIDNDSGYIWCNRGWHDEATNTSSFGRGTIIYNLPTWLITDSIYYERNIGYARIYKTFEYHDTASKIHVFGDTAEMWNREGRVRAYNRPQLIYESENKKPIFVRADILNMTQDTLKRKSFAGYGRARIYNKDFQSICDTFVYHAQDSMMSMHQKPYVWLIDEQSHKISQLSGHTVRMYLKNKQLELVKSISNAMLIQQEYLNYYNQISGDTIVITFDNRKVKKLHSILNAKSIYLAEDPPKGYLGLNNAESQHLVAHFDSGKLQRIVFLNHPKATFYPIKDITTSNSRLPQFIWNEALRPKNEFDLMPK